MRKSSDYEKRLLAKLDKGKMVRFRNSVVDCEHEGDMWHEECAVRDYVAPLGGQVTQTYWDGMDCGEALVECEVPYAALEKVLPDGFFDSEPYQ